MYLKRQIASYCLIFRHYFRLGCFHHSVYLIRWITTNARLLLLRLACMKLMFDGKDTMKDRCEQECLKTLFSLKLPFDRFLSCYAVSGITVFEQTFRHVY